MRKKRLSRLRTTASRAERVAERVEVCKFHRVQLFLRDEFLQGCLCTQGGSQHGITRQQRPTRCSDNAEDNRTHLPESGMEAYPSAKGRGLAKEEFRLITQ